MYVGTDWDPIDTGLEAQPFTLDFKNDIAASDTINSVVFSLAVLIGTDPTPSARLTGLPAISGTQVSQVVDVRSAPAGVYYRLTATCATVQQTAVTLWSHFWSRTPA
jgi:hypothetical protein